MATLVEDLLDDGWHLALVHGNGPQVGNLGIQQEAGAKEVPAQPLFSLVAMTQGELGSLITCAVHGSGRQSVVACLLAHVVVDPDDPAMNDPTKPIGPFLSEDEALRMERERGWHVRKDAGRGYRRVVPSPRPTRIVEIDAVRTLLEAGHIVVAAGGGGIPVHCSEDGTLTGVDAVIDKDYAAAELAAAVGAQALVIVTAVDAVQLDFGTDRQRPIEQIDIAEAEKHLADGQFPEGSMGPKIRAAIQFLHGGGELAVITTAEHAAAAVRGSAPGGKQAGTRIVAEHARHTQPEPAGGAS